MDGSAQSASPQGGLRITDFGCGSSPTVFVKHSGVAGLCKGNVVPASHKGIAFADAHMVIGFCTVVIGCTNMAVAQRFVIHGTVSLAAQVVGVSESVQPLSVACKLRQFSLVIVLTEENTDGVVGETRNGFTDFFAHVEVAVAVGQIEHFDGVVAFADGSNISFFVQGSFKGKFTLIRDGGTTALGEVEIGNKIGCKSALNQYFAFESFALEGGTLVQCGSQYNLFIKVFGLCNYSRVGNILRLTGYPSDFDGGLYGSLGGKGKNRFFG